MSLWEERSRQEVHAARDKLTSVVRDELSNFLDTLILALASKSPETKVQNDRIAAIHGQQRSGTLNYTLPQMMQEYSILREVIIEVLRRSSPIPDEDQDIIHSSIDASMVIASNEFAQAEQAQLKLALTRAEQSNRDLDQFAAVLAHDLRSPLGIITGFTQLMEEELKDNTGAHVQEAMTYIRNAVSRMVNLIDGILGYARLGSQASNFEKVKSDEAVLAAIQNLKAPLTESAGRVHFEELPTVYGNLPLLTQLFQNLIANSIKYRSHDAPIMKVSAQEGDEVWTFLFKDNGIGFDPKEKDSIFKFNKRLSSDNQGAGIGLATCQRVVELHGGKIWAESELGKGAAFYFTLPKEPLP